MHTGFVRGAGTSAEVSIVMNGSVGDSDPRVLKDPERKTFRTGGVDAFLMTAPQSLGVLRNIRLWHNNGGDDPSWNLLRLMIQDLQTQQRWWFVCDEWLAVDEGDGKIERILYPATSNELTKFNVLFATEVSKNDNFATTNQLLAFRYWPRALGIRIHSNTFQADSVALTCSTSMLSLSHVTKSALRDFPTSTNTLATGFKPIHY